MKQKRKQFQDYNVSVTVTRIYNSSKTRVHALYAVTWHIQYCNSLFTWPETSHVTTSYHIKMHFDLQEVFNEVITLNT